MMMTYILSLIALPLLCVLWIVFQGWLAKQDPGYQGYKAGCGGCSRSSCGEKEERGKKKQDGGCDKGGVETIRFVDASDLWGKDSKD